MSVIPYKGKLCKDLLGLTDPYRMTGEFDGVYNPICRTVVMRGHTYNDENRTA